MITLENIHERLERLAGRLSVPEATRVRALPPIERMIAIG